MHTKIIIISLLFFLSLSYAQVTREDISSPYKLYSSHGTGTNCVKEVDHGALFDKNGNIFVIGVKVEGLHCSSHPYIIDTELSEVSQNPVGLSLADAVKNQPNVVVIDKEKRYCQGKYFPWDTVTIFLNSTEEVQLTSRVNVPPGLWAMVANPEKEGFCLYKGIPETQTTRAMVDSTLVEVPMETPTVMETSTSEVDYETIEESPVVEATPISEDEVDVCFPSNAKVRLSNGQEKIMVDLNIGDEVFVRNCQTSKVFMFTHRLTHVPYKFIRVHTDLKNPLVLTASHHIYANGIAKPARELQVGDSLNSIDHGVVYVRKIDFVIEYGLHNPQTFQGDIVVDGIVTTTFTSSMNQNIAQALLSPLRMAFLRMGWFAKALEDGRLAAKTSKLWNFCRAT